MKNRPIPKGAKTVPEKATKVFQGEIFEVYQWPQKQFDGSIATFEMLKRPDTVLVLPVDRDGSLWVIREEQPGGNVYELDIPGGRVDLGESVLAAAKRECEEEIGVRFRDWYYVESIQPHRKLDWFVHVFIAKNPVETVPTHHDAGEKIEIYKSTYQEFLRKNKEAGRFDAFVKHKTLEGLTASSEKLG